MSVRLPAWLDADVREFISEQQMGPSRSLRVIVEEWWVLSHWPTLEFRDGVLGRCAALRGGPEVWELLWWARDFAENPKRFFRDFQWAGSSAALQSALDYYECFPERVARFQDMKNRAQKLLESERVPR
ncbi:MAG: hypothetical protein ACE5HQ_13490 [Gemmatimonadota bacterium]